MGATARPAGREDAALATWFPVAFAAGVLVVALALVLARGFTASDGGGHIDGDVLAPLGLTVHPPDPGVTDLESGMVVEAIDGVSVDDMLSGSRPSGAADPGSQHEYRVFDGGRVRDMAVRLVEPRVGRGLGEIAEFLWFVLGTTLVAAYTFARRHTEPAAAALLSFAVCLLSAALLTVTTVEPADLAFRPAYWCARW